MIVRARGFVGSDFVRHGAIVFVSSTLINIFGYVFHFAISRKLGVVRYGELSALNAAFMVSLVVPQIISTVVVKYAAGYHATDDRERLAMLTRRLIRFAIIGMVAALAVLLVLAAPIAAFLRVDDPYAVAVAVTMIAFSMATGSLRGIYQGIEDFNGYAISVVIESLLKMILGIGLAYAGFGVIGAFGGWACGSFAALIYTIVSLRKGVGAGRGAALDLHLGRLARTMSGVAAAMLLLATIANADLIVVKHVADPTAAGLYGALSLAGKILLFLVAFVPLVVLPKATRRALSGQRPGGVLLQALAVSAGMSIPGLVFYYFLPRFVVTTLAGGAFAAAAPFVFPYAVAMVELAFVNVFVTYKIGIHRFDFILPLTLCAVGEIFGIAVFHSTLIDVTLVLIIGNLFAAVAASWQITAPAKASGSM